jgi:hypothetical protein
MTRQLMWTCVGLALACAANRPVTAQFAVEVLSYSAGTNPAPGFIVPASAIGPPERFSGEGVFPGVVSPFSPPFLNSEIVSIGEAGQLTLRLSHYALPQAVGPEIGVFVNAGLFDADFPNGRAGSPPATFGVDRAMVDVSENGADWVSLGEFTFDIPTNGYTDLSDPFSAVPGGVESDFQQPFVGSLADFDGLAYSHPSELDMLELLAGSGGGTWLDISGSGLAQVGYIRFSVPNDMTATNFKFELDAVSISHMALASATVPEARTAVTAITLALGLIGARVRRRFQHGYNRGKCQPDN